MKQDEASTKVRANLGLRIRSLREAQGISQRTFSAMIGMDHSYLLSIEKGRRNVSIDNLFKIANGLNVPLSHLLETVDAFARKG